MINDNNKTIIPFRQVVVQARTCDITAADILSERDLMIANLEWTDPVMQAESEAKLIKHERALEMFVRKAA
jgi:hypothetical protein